MAYNASTTIGEILSLAQKILDENDIFKIGKRQAAKIFLKKLLDLNEHVTDAEAEAAYRACSPRREVPESSEEFWTFVEKEYLHLEGEPKDSFLELSFQVVEDLAGVDAHLQYIKKEIESLENKKKNGGRLSAEERYYKNQLEYFEKKNLVAKNEIVDFMTHKIKGYAINKAFVKPPYFNSSIGLGLFFGNSAYAFGRRFAWSRRDQYDVRSLDEFSNKFLDLPVSDYWEWVEECKKSPEKFKEYAVAYINGISELGVPRVRTKIEELVGQSHILASRKQVIETMLGHFEAKDYISFVSMAPLQIEGIFADICREIGISEHQLDASSLNDKLQHIEGKMRSFFFFEYYAFKFPILRNLIAHGGLVDGELEDIAIRLMLDLLPVCELTTSEDLPIINALKVLNEASKGKHKKLVEWLDLCGTVKIPGFYDVQEKIAAAEVLYASEEFWTYLEGEIKKLKDVSEVERSMPVKAAGILKSKGIAEDRASVFLKSSVCIVRNAIEKRSKTLEQVTSTLKSDKPNKPDA